MSKIRYSNMAVGSAAYFIIFLLSTGFIITLGLYSIPLILPVLALVTLQNTVTFDTELSSYRKGYTIFGLINTGKWTIIGKKCYLKIEPFADVKSFDSGRIDHGSITTYSTGLYFVDKELKRKIYLEDGAYSQMKTHAEKLSNQLFVKVVDYKERAKTKNKRAPF